MLHDFGLRPKGMEKLRGQTAEAPVALLVPSPADRGRQELPGAERAENFG